MPVVTSENIISDLINMNDPYSVKVSIQIHLIKLTNEATHSLSQVWYITELRYYISTSKYQ